MFSPIGGAQSGLEPLERESRSRERAPAVHPQKKMRARRADTISANRSMYAKLAASVSLLFLRHTMRIGRRPSADRLDIHAS